MSDFHEFSAIKVDQPFSSYFICKIPAKILREISYSFEAVNTDGKVRGLQRFLKKDRLIEIGKFIDSESAAFPNPIILAANYSPSGRLVENDDRECKYEQIGDDLDLYKLKIPKGLKILSVIDGQHRLFAFDYAKHKDMDLTCSIYFNLPTPYQAYLFSTINFNQGKVDKSLAYQLFGYELESEEPDLWPPETLAVFFARRFNESGPLKGRLKFRTADERTIKKIDKPNWSLSTAAVTEVILSFISDNPKDDRYSMNQRDLSEDQVKGRKVLDDDPEYPLRASYINENDKAIEEVFNLALNEIDKIFWSDESHPESILKKTIGFMALFKFLKLTILKYNLSKKTISVIFPALLKCSIKEDFENKTKYPASTKGLKIIVDTLIKNSDSFDVEKL